ncbi:MAG: hypothetical protein EXR79_11295 [Myxococcales bacterium]|nr:hypothetical protein [Myxococcales bacterium]
MRGRPPAPGHGAWAPCVATTGTPWVAWVAWTAALASCGELEAVDRADAAPAAKGADSARSGADASAPADAGELADNTGLADNNGLADNAAGADATGPAPRTAVYAHTAWGPPCPDVAGAAPKACFTACEPTAQSKVTGAGPVPDPKQCTFDPGLLWPKGPTPPPTLTVELGAVHPKTGAFVPYQDGQWAPIVHGVQGGIHVWTALRTTLPGFQGAKATLEVGANSYLDCKNVATELARKPIAFADPSQPGTWTTASLLLPPTPVAFDENVPGPYCGKWIVLRAEVRLPGTQQWGHAVKVLRLYDLANPL